MRHFWYRLAEASYSSTHPPADPCLIRCPPETYKRNAALESSDSLGWKGLKVI